VIGITEERRTLGTQPHELGDHCSVVRRTPETASRRGLVDALAQFAIGEAREQRLVGGVLQRDHPLAREAAPRRGCGSGAELLGRQSIELRRIIDYHGALGGSLEDVLLEACGEGGDLLVQILQTRLLVCAETRAGTHEYRVVAGQQLQGLGIEMQTRALVVERIDTGPERWIEVDRIALRRQARCHVGVDALHLRVGVAGIEVREGGFDALEHPPGTLERHHRVREGRRGGVVRDGLDLAQLLGHARIERRAVVAIAYAVEGRELEGERTRGSERVVGHCRGPWAPARGGIRGGERGRGEHGG
jgi:hypothetical protein